LRCKRRCLRIPSWASSPTMFDSSTQTTVSL
jgi:hypothetical protein